MNYIGSKLRLSSFIYDTIKQVAGTDLSLYTFCDLFTGTGTVSLLFKNKVKKIIANDREYYSFVLNKAHLENSVISLPDYDLLIQEINLLNGTPGFVFQQYAENGKAGRLYFSERNGKRIDAIRLKIEQWKNSGTINENMYFLLLASLIRSADKVANTTSVYAAYLKNLKQSAQQDMLLTPILFDNSVNPECEIYQEDSNGLINKIEGDILYLDPPYNRREYASNYHLLNTIALYDTAFIPKGKTGMRKYKTSRYCRKPEAAIALEELLNKARFRYIFLSYNNEGWISSDGIQKIMKKYGNYHRFTCTYKRFKSQKIAVQDDTTTEFIHVLLKE